MHSIYGESRIVILSELKTLYNSSKCLLRPCVRKRFDVLQYVQENGHARQGAKFTMDSTEAGNATGINEMKLTGIGNVISTLADAVAWQFGGEDLLG